MDDGRSGTLTSPDIPRETKVFLVFVFLIYLEGRVMKAFPVITIIALILLVG